MRSVETTAKSRKDAIDQALAQLGAELPDVRVEILQEGSSGFLGLGARPWNVRVTLEGEEEPQPAPRKQREERGRDRKRDQPPPQREPKRQDRDQGRSQAKTNDNDRGGRDGRGKRAGQKPGGKPDEAKKSEPKPQRDETKRPRQAPPSTERRPLSDENTARGNEAAALLKELIAQMGMEADVQASQTPDGSIFLDVQSPDSAILIGRKGRSLSALQYIINRMMPLPGEDEGDARLLVDVEKYQERRREKLHDQALSYAEKAKKTGRRMRVKPMPAQERRVVHVALQDDDDVRTFSIGDGALRSVIIAPKNEDDTAANSEGDSRGNRGGRRRGGRRGGGKGRSRGGNRQNQGGRQHTQTEGGGDS